MIDVRTAPLGTLILRLALAATFLAHGLDKILTLSLQGTVDLYTAAGYPAAVAYLVIVSQVGGGLALLVGLWTRWVALLLCIEAVGMAVRHWSVGWFFGLPGGGWEFPALLAVALFVLSMLGDGAMAFSGRAKSAA